MPITSTPDHELEIVYTVCSDIVTRQCVEQYQLTVWLDPSIYGYNELFDFADCDYSNINFSDLISIAQQAAKLYMLDPASRIAFLTHSPQQHEVAEFYISAKSVSKGTSRDIKNFNCRQQAMRWLTEEYR